MVLYRNLYSSPASVSYTQQPVRILGITTWISSNWPLMYFFFYKWQKSKVTKHFEVLDSAQHLSKYSWSTKQCDLALWSGLCCKVSIGENILERKFLVCLSSPYSQPVRLLFKNNNKKDSFKDFYEGLPKWD